MKTDQRIKSILRDLQLQVGHVLNNDQTPINLTIEHVQFFSLLVDELKIAHSQSKLDLDFPIESVQKEEEEEKNTEKQKSLPQENKESVAEAKKKRAKELISEFEFDDMQLTLSPLKSCKTVEDVNEAYKKIRSNFLEDNSASEAFDELYPNNDMWDL